MLVLGLDVVPEQVLRPKEPRTLVAHDEVDGLDLATDEDALLDQLTLNLVWVVLVNDLRLPDDLRGPDPGSRPPSPPHSSLR